MAISYGKRGQELERLIERSNEIYRNRGMALVYKIPTPWNIYYNKKTGQVFKAFPAEKSTVDFIGISHGRGIAFDAKSTNNRTSFPLNNIKPHQIEYLKRFREQGGEAFFIVEFAKLHEVYFLPIKAVLSWWEASLNGGRKSIPYEWFLENCKQIRPKNDIPLDYLACCKIHTRKEVLK